MIIMLILTPIFLLINSLLDLLPNVDGLPNWLNDILIVLGYAFNIFPIDCWIFFLGSVFFWNFALIGWSIIEWIYKKIPGVD